jgi:hypothetical protein
VRALITFEATLSEDSGVRYPAPTLIGCLVVKEPGLSTAHPALPFASLRQQQRKRLCRAFFVSSTVSAIFFCCGQRCKLRCANLPADPATLAAPALQRRVVLRGGEY